MSFPFSPSDQPDYRNAPPPADIRELILFRDMDQAAATNIVGMLDGIRGKDRNWCGASVRTAMAHARNMAESYLAALDTVEAEARYHLAEREGVIHRLPVVPRSRGIPTGVPATVSPAGAA